MAKYLCFVFLVIVYPMSGNVKSTEMARYQCFLIRGV